MVRIVVNFGEYSLEREWKTSGELIMFCNFISIMTSWVNNTCKNLLSWTLKIYILLLYVIHHTSIKRGIVEHIVEEEIKWESIYKVSHRIDHKYLFLSTSFQSLSIQLCTMSNDRMRSINYVL